MKTLCVSLTAAACVLLIEVALGDQCGGGPVRECRASADGCGTPDCCAQCGCHCACQRKVCQVVCGTERVTKHCWCVECEEFCAPLPGCGPVGQLAASCRACDCGCNPCCDGCRGKRCCDGCPVPPKCGPVRTKKKLVKKEYECEVPVYKCVVKYLCPGCCEGPCDESEAEPSQPLPPPPAPSQQAFAPAPTPPLWPAPWGESY